MRRLLLGLAVLAAFLSSCVAAAAPAAPGATPKKLAKLCSLPYVDADVVEFSGGGSVRLVGAAAGKGSVGVLLANTSDGSMCDWVANENKLINLLVSKGYRVLLFDYKGSKWDANVAGAAAELRALGSRKVVLVGASAGGIVAIGAGTKIKPAPVAVVGLSASGGSDPTSTGKSEGGVDGKAAAATLRVPLLLVTAKDDPYAFAPTKALYRATREKDKQLLVVPGQSHGFFDADPSGAKVNARVLAFIEAHTR